MIGWFINALIEWVFDDHEMICICSVSLCIGMLELC